MSAEDTAARRKSSQAMYNTLSAGSVDKKRDRPRRAESSVGSSSRKKIASASLRQGGLADSSEETNSGSASARSARGPRRSLLPSGSHDALDQIRNDDVPPRVVSLETQLASLEPFGTGSPAETFRASPGVSQRYREFVTWARRLNYGTMAFEVVLLGLAGVGKSALLESLIGFPLCPVGAPTKRAIHFQLMDGPTGTRSADPKFTVRDSQGDISFTTVDQAAAEIRKRNKRSPEPLFVQIEADWGLEMTIVDTPGIRTPDELLMWTQPSSATGVTSRVFLCVESCPSFTHHRTGLRVTDSLSILPLLRRLHPSSSKTLCVMTKFDSFLESCCGEGAVVEASLSAAAVAGVFFCTTPSDELRAAALARAESHNDFKRILHQLDERDLHSLRKWFDISTCSDLVGTTHIRRNLHILFEKHLLSVVPALSHALSDYISSLSAKLEQLKRIRSRWTTENIRSSASQYSTLYLRFLDDLISGSTVGDPHARGQTLRDEEADAGTSWSASFDFSNPLTSARPSGQTTGLRLYGAPQVFRLLDDFRAFALKLEMPPVADSELSITSVDPAWTAAEIARSKVEQQFVPLMHQLLDRAFQVLKRTACVADAVADDYVTAGAHADQPALRSAYPSKHRRSSATGVMNSITSESVQTGDSKTLSKGHGASTDRGSESSTADFEDLDILQDQIMATRIAAVASTVTQREFPAFSSFLKQSFLFALHSLQSRCLQRCEDEFYGAHTLYWELTGGVDPLALAGLGIAERQVSVKKLVGKLYAEIKSRIIDGFVRNVQTYFLSQSSFLELMKSVAADVATLSDDSVQDMFKFGPMTSSLDKRISSLSQKLSLLSKAQDHFDSQMKLSP